MLEVPRAFLRAERIASEKHIDFVSIGTNDLTQMVFGFSRDDTQRFMVSSFQLFRVCATLIIYS
jgi:pyruvate,orthophosphate dikinase